MNYEEDGIDEKDQAGYEADKEVFMQQLEGDREMRANILLYKNQLVAKKAAKAKKEETVAMETEEDRDYDDEEIRLDELLDDMTLAVDLTGADESEKAKEIPVISGEELQKQLAEGEASSTSNFDSAPFEGKSFQFL